MSTDIGRTEIINQALLYANQDTILDGRGETKNAKLCGQFYTTALQEALSSHPWSFALRATQLQLLSEAPKDYRFEYAYQLPKDFGRIQTVTSSALEEFNSTNEVLREIVMQYSDRANTIAIPEYMVQGDKLFSNQTDLQLLYSRNEVLVSEMSPQFRNYFAAYLSSKVFVKITGGVDGFKELKSMVSVLLTEARHADSDQTDTLTPNRPNLFISARIY